MFETGRAIREAKLRQIRDEGWREGWQEGWQEGLLEGREEGRREMIELVRMTLKEAGVSLPPEVAAQLYEEQPRNRS